MDVSCDDTEDRSGVLVLIRGGGELGSAVAHRLCSAGFSVIVTEVAVPLAVRRRVAFCEVLRDASQPTVKIQGVTGRRCESVTEALVVARSGAVAILIDPQLKVLEELRPPVLVDAIMAKGKWKTGTKKGMASVVVGMGPGFVVGVECDYLVETARGHRLGMLYTRHGESALPFTGKAGDIGGATTERVLRAPVDGELRHIPGIEIASQVTCKQIICTVGGEEVCAGVAGRIRGLLPDRMHVRKDLKIGDVDPRGQITEECTAMLSDKGRCVSGAVLQVIVDVLGLARAQRYQTLR